ncbi:MAG: ureidoglycolate lyase [bacterium]|nr:MAG: ureidoglycolate lyase [bacterium]
MIKIKSIPITKENFNKFGKVVTSPTTKPTAQAADYKFWSDLANYLINGETEIGLCTVYQQPTTEISGMERHTRTPEILIPIDAPLVVPLLRDGDSAEQAEAFQVTIGQAVVIDEGIWHGACLPVGRKESSYFVIFRRNTPQEDVEKKEVTTIEIVKE